MSEFNIPGFFPFLPCSWASRSARPEARRRGGPRGRWREGSMRAGSRRAVGRRRRAARAAGAPCRGPL